MILEVFASGPVHTNSILIGCSLTRKCAIVDAPFQSSPLLLDAIEKLKLQPEMILVTHSHWDHIAEVASLRKKLTAPVYVHTLDAPNLEKPGSDGLPLLFPVTGVEPDHLLQDGDMLRVGSLHIQVIHTPGHTPGGVCFWIEQEKLLLSGDTLFHGTIGRLNFPTSRPDLMWDSLQRLSRLPPDTRVIPGHGSETTIKAESWLSHAKQKFGL